MKRPYTHPKANVITIKSSPLLSGSITPDGRRIHYNGGFGDLEEGDAGEYAA